jgi:hypothetical protein
MGCFLLSVKSPLKVKKRTSQQLPNALYQKLIGSCEPFDRKGFLKRPLILPIDPIPCGSVILAIQAGQQFAGGQKSARL